MMRSMTGFAERSFSGSGLQVRICLKSLNHRFFDWVYKGTPLGELENRLRAAAQQTLHRGRIEASVEVIFVEPSGWQVRLNDGLLGKILAAWNRACQRLGKSVPYSLDHLFTVPQLMKIERKKFSSSQADFLEQSFKQTMAAVVKQRQREGRHIASQVKKHLAAIGKSLQRIERLSRRQPSLLRQRVLERIEELNAKVSISPARLEEEVAFLSQRAGIAEEILRLRAHVDSFRKVVEEASGEPVGKRLDFLAQEIYREANTINSKSQDLAIIRESLAIKNEVESLRQHAQNLE